ncbi:hypothetical protein SteCoe_28954 [Stentor coeruleus]|uniref:PIPK domain-containing protein n=1 Tax=Stentor coeruleus TaxID=5963 RepID=A0A1R2B724_9CILI|nr:hypothetical protein SteCoe_28954 [Stentor coeruleus]
MDAFDIVSAILTTISLLLSIFSILIHLQFRRLLKPPGELIFIQCIAQFFIDIHWYSSIFIWYYSYRQIGPKSSLCTFIGCIAVFFTSISMNYLLALCIEVTIKLHSRSYDNYAKRKVIYHLASVSFAMFLVIRGIVCDEYGGSTINTCSLIHGTTTSQIRQDSFYVEIGLMTILIIYIMVKIGKIYSRVTFNYFLVIISMSVLVILTNVLKEISESTSDPDLTYKFANILGSATGIATGVARAWNKNLLKMIYWKYFSWCRKKQKKFIHSADQPSEDSFINSNIYYLGDLFDSMTIKSLLQMLSVVSLRFKNPDPLSMNIENEKCFDEYEFDDKLFKQLIEEYQMPRIKESNYYTVYTPDLVLTEYKPKIFAKIRSINGVSDEKIFRSFFIPDNLDNIKSLHTAKGRSNAKVFFTADQEFVVKTITRKERKFFIRVVLKEYSERIEKNNSYLVRILGMYRLSSSGTDYIVMENIVKQHNTAVIFDIKGSTVNRNVEGDFDYTNPPYGLLLKDLNLKASGYKIRLPNDEKNNLIEGLFEDLQLLSKHEIIDYSLLVSFFKPNTEIKSRYTLTNYKQTYAFGIIDYMQSFTVAKASERCLKKIFHRGKQISVESPDFYKERLEEEIKILIP